MVRGEPGLGHRGGRRGHRDGLRPCAIGPPAVKLDLYTRLYLWLASHRRLVLAATFLVTVASLVVSSRIDLEEDVLAILPQHDQIVDDYQYAIRKFRQVDRVYFDVGLNHGDSD